MSAGKKAKCAKCSTVIQSLDVHHMTSCKCGAISIDGGEFYTRCIGSPADFIWEFEDEGITETQSYNSQ